MLMEHGLAQLLKSSGPQTLAELPVPGVLSNKKLAALVGLSPSVMKPQNPGV